jgi:hypothetical protein
MKTWKDDYIDTILSCIGGAIVLSIFCMQCQAGYETYQKESINWEKQNWLKIQCQNESFYTNMKTFSNICDNVLKIKDPVRQALDMVLNPNEIRLKLYILGWTILLCKFMWNLIKNVFLFKDYINSTLPK